MAPVEVAARVHHWANEDLTKVTSKKEGFLASSREQNFGAFFTRDAAITSLLALDLLIDNPQEFNHLKEPIRRSLLTMYLYQGQGENYWRDEEKGKLPHEVRWEKNETNQKILGGLKDRLWCVEGEDGNLSMKYFGSIDATPLGVMAAAKYLNNFEDEAAKKKLESGIRKSCDWLISDMEKHGGYVAFSAKNRHALLNQGWKDSFDSIESEPYRRPVEPIALCEVQGYTFAALSEAAELFRRKGDIEYSTKLYQTAGHLKTRFNEDFWMEDKNYFAYALDGKHKQVKDITSNAGHLLITGILDNDRAKAVVNRLMESDMLTDSGIRTLSLDSHYFSDSEPSAYHNGGSIWPHDNALIAMGMKKYGFEEEAEIVEDRVIAAQEILERDHGIHDPELYMVDRDGKLRPYDTAQQPQTWAVVANLVLTRKSLAY